MNATRQYELVYIVSPEATEQEVNDLHAQVETIAGRFGGQLERTENWGRRRLAYEIGHHREGTYVLEVLNGSGEMVKELDRRLRVTDNVIRHLVVRVDEELSVAERTRTHRQQTTARRRIARGLPPEVEPGERQREGREPEVDEEGPEGLEGQS
jgi:small subunit ribosomal protein S6